MLSAFEHGGSPEPTSCTDAEKGVLPAAVPVKCSSHGGDHASACRSKWMTESDTTTVDVETVRVDAANGFRTTKAVLTELLIFQGA